MISCNSRPEEKVTTPVVTIKEAVVPKISLSGTVYLFGAEFNAKECETVVECDCCSMRILFTDDENFVTVLPCESDQSLLRGTYKINKDKVVLSYDTLEVDSSYNWEAEADTTKSAKPEYIITLKKSDLNLQILEPLYCKDTLYFKLKGDDTLMYGSIDTQYSFNERIQQLKDEGVWDEIQQ